MTASRGINQRLTPERVEQALLAIAEHGTIRGGCEAIGLSDVTFRQAIRRDPSLGVRVGELLTPRVRRPGAGGHGGHAGLSDAEIDRFAEALVRLGCNWEAAGRESGVVVRRIKLRMEWDAEVASRFRPLVRTRDEANAVAREQRERGRSAA